MKIAPAYPCPTQVIRNPVRLEPPREIAQLPQVVAIQRIGGSNRQRHAMHRDRVAGAHAFEHFERAPARDHEIFRDDLEPIDAGTRLQHVTVVLTPEPDAVAEHREVATFQHCCLSPTSESYPVCRPPRRIPLPTASSRSLCPCTHCRRRT